MQSIDPSRSEKVMPNQEEDLVTKLKVWLMESETFSIKVILHLVVELSLKGNQIN
jgi:hypothetical protein